MLASPPIALVVVISTLCVVIRSFPCCCVLFLAALSIGSVANIFMVTLLLVVVCYIFIQPVAASADQTAVTVFLV